jgi:opacity protein-like surface antigen
MRKVVVAIFVLVMAASTFAAGQDSKATVFGGWQFLSIDTKDSSLGRQNTAEGWDADFASHVARHVSVVSDISGSYKSFSNVSTPAGTFSPYIHAYNFLFGPRFTAKSGKFTPFAEALFGFDRASLGASSSGVSASISSNGFALAFGGGLDDAVTKRLSLRLVKFDYLMDRVNFSSSVLNASTGSQNLNNFRISIGVVYKF